MMKRHSITVLASSLVRQDLRLNDLPASKDGFWRFSAGPVISLDYRTY